MWFNYIFLINGNLTITKPISAPVGVVDLFTSSGNIIVSSTVGSSSPSDCYRPASQLQGFFSSDKKFTIQGNASVASFCSTTGATDPYLGIEGTVIVNASKGDDTNNVFDNERTLCTANYTSPSVTIHERPDMILNAPDVLKSLNYLYTQVAP